MTSKEKKKSCSKKSKSTLALEANPSSKANTKKRRTTQAIEVVGERELHTWDENEQNNLEIFNNIKVEPTRFAGICLLKQMGILNTVAKILDLMGVQPEFLKTRELTYRQVTRQFLVTLKVEYEVEKYDEKDPSAKQPNQSEGKISFKIQGISHSCSIEKLCQIFGFKNGSLHSKDPPKHNPAWDFMTGEKEVSFCSSYTSKIRNPSLRYTARLLALTLFARPDTSKVQLNELGLLSLVTMSTPSITEDENLGCLLLDHWLTFVKEAKKKPQTKVIYFGGMITKLLRGLNVDVTWDKMVISTVVPIMDSGYMKRMHFFKEELKDTQGNLNYVYEFLAAPNATRHCLLPIQGYDTLSVESMQFIIPDNLLYNYGEGDKQEEEDDEDYEFFENFMHVKLRSLESFGIPPELPPPTSDEASSVYRDHLQLHKEILEEHHKLLERMLDYMKVREKKRKGTLHMMP